MLESSREPEVLELLRRAWRRGAPLARDRLSALRSPVSSAFSPRRSLTSSSSTLPGLRSRAGLGFGSCFGRAFGAARVIPASASNAVGSTSSDNTPSRSKGTVAGLVAAALSSVASRCSIAPDTSPGAIRTSASTRLARSRCAVRSFSGSPASWAAASCSPSSTSCATRSGSPRARRLARKMGCGGLRSFASSAASSARPSSRRLARAAYAR